MALVEALKEGRAVAIVGSGASYPSGGPKWGELLGEMRDEAGRSHPEEAGALDKVDELIKEKQFLTAASILQSVLGPEFYSVVVALLRVRNMRPGPVHRMLCQLPFAAYVTTNYDCLIEEATLSGTSLPAYSNSYEYLGERIRDGKQFAFKLHGDINHKEDIVMSRSDYARVMNSCSSRDAMDGLLKTKVCFWLGYGHADPDLDLLLDEHRRTLNLKGGFSVGVMDLALKLRLEEAEISPSWLPSYDDVPEFVRGLARAVGTPLILEVVLGATWTNELDARQAGEAVARALTEYAQEKAPELGGAVGCWAVRPGSLRVYLEAHAQVFDFLLEQWRAKEPDLFKILEGAGVLSFGTDDASGAEPDTEPDDEEPAPAEGAEEPSGAGTSESTEEAPRSEEEALEERRRHRAAQSRFNNLERSATEAAGSGLPYTAIERWRGAVAAEDWPGGEKDKARARYRLWQALCRRALHDWDRDRRKHFFVEAVRIAGDSKALEALRREAGLEENARHEVAAAVFHSVAKSFSAREDRDLHGQALVEHAEIARDEATPGYHPTEAKYVAELAGLEQSPLRPEKFAPQQTVPAYTNVNWRCIECASERGVSIDLVPQDRRRLKCANGHSFPGGPSCSSYLDSHLDLGKHIRALAELEEGRVHDHRLVINESVRFAGATLPVVAMISLLCPSCSKRFEVAPGMVDMGLRWTTECAHCKASLDLTRTAPSGRDDGVVFRLEVQLDSVHRYNCAVLHLAGMQESQLLRRMHEANCPLQPAFEGHPINLAPLE